MSGNRQLAPAVALWAAGGLGVIGVLAAYFSGSLYLALAFAIAIAALCAFLGRSAGGQEEALKAGLLRLQARKRDFLYDEVRGWREAGELGALVSEAVEYNMHRREFYRGAVQAVGTPFLLCDPKGEITHVSEAMLKLLHKAGADILGRTVAEAFYNRKKDSITERVLESKQDVSQEVVLKFWDGRSADMLAVVNCIRSASGEVLGAVVCLADLSDVKAKELALQEQQQRVMQVGNSINDLAQRVASASEELSASADEQARGANRQKGQTESVSTAMEEMTATVVEVAQNATQSADAASTALSSASEGVRLVRESVAGIKQVAESSRRLAEVLGQLDTQAAEIDRIISVINDIADQTNLLALNAAIEAARAGDAGRGFAVVADEVRKLAEKTMTATKEVENSIREIQERSQHAVTTMRETERQVNVSTELSSRTGESLEEIMRRIEDVTGRVAQIATAAEEQSAAAEEINRNIEDIAGIAKEAEEGAEQSAAATRELAELAQNLLQLSMSFSATKADASKLRSSHGQMKGILPKLMLEFVKGKYGERVHAKVAEALGNPMFLPTSSYPDQVLQQMAEETAKAAGQETRKVFVDLGRYTIGQFYKMYRSYFKAPTLKEFLLTMNQTHAELTKAVPGIVPPRFSYEDRGNKLTMIYKSRRGYHYYFEGILRGAAEHFKTPVDITVQVQDPETARAEVVFR